MTHTIESIGRMFQGLSFNTFIGKVAITAGTFLTGLFTPIAALLISCFFFTLLDMVYGIKVAIKQKQKITSDKNWKGTLVKMLDEFGLIALFRLLEYSVLGTDTVSVLTGGVTSVICLTEAWSILENLNTLNPDGPWRALSKFLKKKGEDYIGTEIELENDCDSEIDSESQDPL